MSLRTELQRRLFANAGFSYPAGASKAQQRSAREKSARVLGDAYTAAIDTGHSFAWSIDPLADSSDFSDNPEPWQLWQCVIYNAEGAVIGSLGGVDFGRGGEPWGNSYREVVEAELSLEHVK